MFFFSNIFKQSANFDLARKNNSFAFKNKKKDFGENLKLSFLNSGIKKQQRIKIKNLLLLELLSLRKAFFNLILNKQKRKKTFGALETYIWITKKYQDYFLYHFSKNAIGSIKNLPVFYIQETKGKKNTRQEVEPGIFDVVNQNAFYFNDLKTLKIQNISKNQPYKLKL